MIQFVRRRLSDIKAEKSGNEFNAADYAREYWEKENLPFVGLADPEHNVAQEYGQEVKLLRMGRMPALVVVGKDGQVHYQHYGDSMRDIAPNEEVLAVLDNLNSSTEV